MKKHIKIKNLWSNLYLPKEKTNEIVIGVHGFSGDKESSVLIALGEELNKNGIALITFDLPCHGENDNTKPINLRECENSIGTIFDYVKENFKNISISVFATSFGAFLTLLYLSTHNEKLDKIILRAPAIFMADTTKNTLFNDHHLTLKDLKQPRNFGYKQPLLADKTFVEDLENNNLDNAQPISHFLYVLQGKKDNVVNPTENARFFDKHYPNNHKIIYFENADHRFKNPGELERIISETISILQNQQTLQQDK